MFLPTYTYTRYAKAMYMTEFLFYFRLLLFWTDNHDLCAIFVYMFALNSVR